jgi:hypothetical protein
VLLVTSPTVTGDPLEGVITYPVIADPPLSVGADQVSDAVPSPAMAATLVGAPGVVDRTVRERLAVMEFNAESVTLTVNVEVPTAIGVPVICPLLFNVNPLDKEPEDIFQVYGLIPPLTVNVVE